MSGNDASDMLGIQPKCVSQHDSDTVHSAFRIERRAFAEKVRTGGVQSERGLARNSLASCPRALATEAGMVLDARHRRKI